MPENEAIQPLFEDFPRQDYGQWLAEVERLLKGAPFAEKMLTRIMEGITVQPLYTAPDLEQLPSPEHFPGQSPYLRGGRAAGNHGSPWLVAQEIPLPTVAEFAAALTRDLQRGQTAVNLILDAAGQQGQDPDQAATGDVGRGGTSLAHVGDLEQALAGIDLEKTPLLIGTGCSGLPVAAILAVVARRRGADPSQVRGCLGGDPLAELAHRGSLARTLEALRNEQASLTFWSAAALPGLRTLAVSEIPFHEGGADGAVSLALMLSSAVATVGDLEGRQVPLEVAFPRVHFQVSVASDFFLEIARLRALRLLWSRVQEAAGLEPTPAFIHARTSRRTLATSDQHVNMLRATTQAMSAVLGGTDSLQVTPFDTAAGLSDEFSRRIARNLQLILAHECRLDQVADPAGGSWYVEKLTADLAASAWRHFQEIEKDGGLLAALRQGDLQRRIAAQATERRSRLASRRDVLVGTNQFVNLAEPVQRARRVDHETVVRQRGEELAHVRSGETGAAGLTGEVGRLLSEDPSGAVEHLISAADLGATLGELSALLETPGEAITVDSIASARDAAPFEALRRRTAALEAVDSGATRVFCACLGDFGRYMPRLDFVRRFFAVGGFSALADEFHTDCETAAAAARQSGAASTVIVGLDDAYEEQASVLARQLKEQAPASRVFLAGSPESNKAVLQEAGVDEFIHLRSDVLDVLGRLARDLEVSS